MASYVSGSRHQLGVFLLAPFLDLDLEIACHDEDGRDERHGQSHFPAENERNDEGQGDGHDCSQLDSQSMAGCLKPERSLKRHPNEEWGRRGGIVRDVRP